MIYALAICLSQLAEKPIHSLILPPRQYKCVIRSALMNISSPRSILLCVDTRAARIESMSDSRMAPNTYDIAYNTAQVSSLAHNKFDSRQASHTQISEDDGKFFCFQIAIGTDLNDVSRVY